MSLKLPDDPRSNRRPGSTTWALKLVKIGRRPPGPSNSGSEATASPPLAPRSPREPLTLTVRLRGGPECWWEIKARGRTYRYPGTLSLHDVLTWINEGQSRF